MELSHFLPARFGGLAPQGGYIRTELLCLPWHAGTATVPVLSAGPDGKRLTLPTRPTTIQPLMFVLEVDLAHKVQIQIGSHTSPKHEGLGTEAPRGIHVTERTDQLRSSEKCPPQHSGGFAPRPLPDLHRAVTR